MTNHICLQTYFSYPLSQWVRSEANELGECVSIFIRDLIVAAYIAQDKEQNGDLNAPDNIRETVYAAVALDAILSAHPDSSLRQKAYDAYARRLQRLGLVPAAIKGGR